MSFASIMKRRGLDYRRFHMLSLSGVYLPGKNEQDFRIPASLERFLREYPDTKAIYLHLDSDYAGRRGAAGFITVLGDRYDVRYGRTSTLYLNMRRASGSFKSRFRTGDIFWNTAGVFFASDRTRERNSFALIVLVTDIPRMRYGSVAVVITKTDRARFAWHLFTKSGSAQQVS